MKQWDKIVAACKERCLERSTSCFLDSGKLIPLLDNAYQGYASGDLAKDGYAQKLKLGAIACHA